jgi:hypothetical protein
MSGYTLNGTPWGGSFILEASTNGTVWETMVAKSSNNTFLGREGLATPVGTNLSSGYNDKAFSNTTFSIYKPSDTYIWPTLGTLTSTGIAYKQTKSCTIIIQGTYAYKNTVDDFNVHLVTQYTTSPYLSPGNIFNCSVTSYLQVGSDWTLTFSCKPLLIGNAFFAVFIRSGQGTGITTILESTPITISTPILLVRYIRLQNISTTDGFSCGKVGLYTSSTNASNDNGTSLSNVIYSAKNTASVTVGYNGQKFGASNDICGQSTWSYQSSSNYFMIMSNANTHYSSIVTFDLGSTYEVTEQSGLFLRLAICGSGSGYSRIKCQISEDNLDYYERELRWVDSGTTYNSKTSAWYTHIGGGKLQMIPTSFSLTNRTTGTQRDLSVDSNRTGVTRGLRKANSITITNQDFSYEYVNNEEWWYMFTGYRGVLGNSPDKQNTIGNQLKVGGGLVYSHNVYSLNCTSLYIVASWEVQEYSHVWGVWASNDQINWIEMASGSWTDRSKWSVWVPNPSDGGILGQSPQSSSPPSPGYGVNFFKLSWTNTQYYVYWKFGIKKAGTPLNNSYSPAACNCGCLYEIEWS